MASPLNHAANRSGKIKNPSKKEAGLDVSHHTLVSREGRGENFFLDILFHRMSAIAWFHQPKVNSQSVKQREHCVCGTVCVVEGCAFLGYAPRVPTINIGPTAAING